LSVKADYFIISWLFVNTKLTICLFKVDKLTICQNKLTHKVCYL
jgi:hypothetical protein